MCKGRLDCNNSSPSNCLRNKFNRRGEPLRNQPEWPIKPGSNLSTSDFQSEVGEVFGEIGGELPAKFGRRFSSFFYWGKSSEAFSTKTPPQISPSNFTTRFWVVAAPTNHLDPENAKGGGAQKRKRGGG